MHARVLVALACALLALHVQAQGDPAADYPGKPVRILVGD